MLEDFKQKFEDVVDTVKHKHESHLPVVIIADTSGSMEGYPIKDLNKGLKTLAKDLSNDDKARKSVEVALISFGGDVSIDCNFGAVDQFSPSDYVAGGGTPMGRGIIKGIKLIQERMKLYEKEGIDKYRPWIFLITDGCPTDMQPGDSLWNQVISEVHRGVANHDFLFYAIATDIGALEALSHIAPPNMKPKLLEESKFKEMFEWLSRSIIKVSNSKPGDMARVGSDEDPWVEVRA